MDTILLKGAPVYKKKLDNLIKQRQTLKFTPQLDIILIGNNKASAKFVAIKQKTAQTLNINVVIHKFDNISEADLLQLIATLNTDSNVHGIIVQLPLPKHLNTNTILNAINPQKDVDGLSASNLGRIYQGNPYLITGAPKAILDLLDFYNISLNKKNIALVGLGKIVGTPLLGLITTQFTINSIKILTKSTEGLKQQLKDCNIIISATGHPHLLTRTNVPKDSIIIDVGSYVDENNKIIGDANFTDLIGHVKAITPNPGGVGPITVLCLFENLMDGEMK